MNASTCDWRNRYFLNWPVESTVIPPASFFKKVLTSRVKADIIIHVADMKMLVQAIRFCVFLRV